MNKFKNKPSIGKFFMVFENKNWGKFKKDYLIYFLAIVFIAGVIIGSNLTYTLNDESYNNFCNVLMYSLSPQSALGFSEIFSNTLTPVIIYIVLLFFCGFCAISQPIIILISFISGVGFGLKSVARFSLSLSRLDMFYIVIISIIELFIIIIILFSCKQSYQISKKMQVKSLTSKSEENKSNRIDVKAYITKFIAYIIFSIIFCLIKVMILLNSTIS
ncbi:MAG: hypothetical protein RSD67_04640 [Oscillospiraceae bacterium]